MTERKRKLDLGDLEAPPSKMSKTSEETPQINPYTGRPYSARYYEILEKRKQLPVWERREEFLKLITEHQVIILQGKDSFCLSDVVVHGHLPPHDWKIFRCNY